jgi:RNA polymerase sigma factor (sigma-70 family)
VDDPDSAAVQDFRALLGRVRGGDQEAARELVREFEPEIRRHVRMQLTNPRLQRTLDSLDICQSVLANFFVRAAAGQFEIEHPEQLRKLLTTMARNRLRDHWRSERAMRRDNRRMEQSGNVDVDAVAARGPTPSVLVAERELLEQLQARLSPEERALADERAAGHEWADIASRVGGSAEAARKRLTRAVNRAARELGLDEALDA